MVLYDLSAIIDSAAICYGFSSQNYFLCNGGWLEEDTPLHFPPVTHNAPHHMRLLLAFQVLLHDSSKHCLSKASNDLDINLDQRLRNSLIQEQAIDSSMSLLDNINFRLTGLAPGFFVFF